MATKVQNINALVAAGAGTADDYAGMKAAAVQKLRDMFAPETTGTSKTDPKADAIAALVAAGAGTADDYAGMPEAVLVMLASKITGSGKTAGQKSADLPKVQLPKVRKVADTDGPLVTRVLTTLAGLKPGTFPLPALVGTDRNGQPKTGTWQPNTTWNVVAETLVDLGFQPVDAKTWADLASTGNVDAQAIVTAFKTPLLEDRKKRVVK